MTRASTLALVTTALPRVWAYDNSPRAKPRQAAYHVTAGAYVDDIGVLTSVPAQPWDPAPPLRMGPQRCLSSRETIERLAFVLPKEPAPVERTLRRAATHWRGAFARDLPDRPEPRRVWMGGDYIDDGTGRPPTKEEAASRWRDVREVIVEASKRYPTDHGSRTYPPPHTRNYGPRG